MKEHITHVLHISDTQSLYSSFFCRYGKTRGHCSHADETMLYRARFCTHTHTQVPME